jgi:hypothetical protein
MPADQIPAPAPKGERIARVADRMAELADGDISDEQLADVALGMLHNEGLAKLVDVDNNGHLTYTVDGDIGRAFAQAQVIREELD